MFVFEFTSNLLILINAKAVKRGCAILVAVISAWVAEVPKWIKSRLFNSEYFAINSLLAISVIQAEYMPEVCDPCPGVTILNN